MKAKKAGCFVLLAFTLIFAIIGAVLFLLPAPTSPVTVSGTPSASKRGSASSWANIYLDFTLENVSDEDIVITYIEVAVSTDNGTERAKANDHITIKAGKSVKCDSYYFTSYNSPSSVTKILVKVNGKEYYAYGTDPGTKTFGVVMFFFAILFAVLTVTNFVNVSKQNKRYADIEKELDARFSGNALLVVGQYSRKGDAGKAALKTTASVAVGALFAGLFGFGAYKIYSGSSMKEFVVTDDKLYIGNPSKSGFNLDMMNFMPQGTFLDSEITVKKNRVILTNKGSGEFFAFDLSSNKSVTCEQLAEKLNKLIAPVEVKTQDVYGEVAAENASENVEKKPDGDDPFDI